jgi:hypothetical protein
VTNAASPYPAPEVPELNSGVLPGNVRPDDWVFLALAIASAALLGVMVLDPPARELGRRIFWADGAPGAVFALEFLWRWRKRPGPGATWAATSTRSSRWPRWLIRICRHGGS